MKKVVKNIADGDAGIDTIVSNMWRLINRDTKDPKVVAIAKQMKGRDDFQTIKNIFQYVRTNYHYKSDPDDTEWITAPKYMASGQVTGEDCDGLVMITVALLQAARIPARIKVIAWRMHDYTHVICEAKYAGNWMVLDPTRSDGFGNQVRKIIREKIYGNPMKLTSLEDGPGMGLDTTQAATGFAVAAPSVPSPTVPNMPGKKPCGCGKKPVNENIININAGNTTTDTNVTPGRYMQTGNQPVNAPAPSTTTAPAPINIQLPTATTPAPAPQVITKTVEIPSRSVTYLKNNTTANYREFY